MQRSTAGGADPEELETEMGVIDSRDDKEEKKSGFDRSRCGTLLLTILIGSVTAYWITADSQQSRAITSDSYRLPNRSPALEQITKQSLALAQTAAAPTLLPTQPTVDTKANTKACDDCAKAVYMHSRRSITCLDRIAKYLSSQDRWTNVAAYHAVGGEALHGKIPCAACKRCNPGGRVVAPAPPIRATPPVKTSSPVSAPATLSPTLLPTLPPVDLKANSQACGDCAKAVYTPARVTVTNNIRGKSGAITCLARIAKYRSSPQWTKTAAYHAVGAQKVGRKIPCAAWKRCDPSLV